jgi:hypothetical protein
VWVTEFGWDASSKTPDPKGEWAKWQDSTDEEQARWLVRSFFLFAEMGVEKAFVYFFNDEDEAKLHAASGLTRHYQPKPAYHAVAWMLRSMENYRFTKAVKKSLDDGYVFEFTPEKVGDPIIWAAWHPTKEAHPLPLDLAGKKVLRQERMPLAKDEPTATAAPEATGALKVGERPILLWLEAAGTAAH